MMIVDKIDLGRVRCPSCKEKITDFDFSLVDDVGGRNISGFGGWNCPCGSGGMFHWDASFTKLELMDDEYNPV